LGESRTRTAVAETLVMEKRADKKGRGVKEDTSMQGRGNINMRNQHEAYYEAT